MSRAAAIAELLGSTTRFVQHAARAPKVLETAIGTLRRSTGAQEVDALFSSLADLLAGIAGMLGEEPPP